MDLQEIISLTDQYVMKTYARYPVAFVKGEGCYLWDTEGKKYLDFLSGIAVNGLGHSHPKIEKAIGEQASRLIHTSNLFYISAQAKLAERLCKNSFADQVFFCNSGAEANEAAIKLARKYAKQHKGPDCYEMITMEQSFHGRTLGTLAATGQQKIKEGFDPHLQGFVHVPYDDVLAVEKVISKKTCAILVEPVQGEGGVRYPSKDYLANLRRLCDEKGLLLIYDEIQTGLGRTGKLFAYEHSGVVPDILTLAKSLAAGLPMGACLATHKVAKSFVPGSHASTFGGNFLVCSAALAFLDILLQKGFLDEVCKVGAYLSSRLRELQNKYIFVNEVRGEGLMLGMELTCQGKKIVENCLNEGLIINCTQGNVLRMLPPLVVEVKEVDEAISILDRVFSKVEIDR